MNVVKIRLRKPRRVLSFLCSELPLNRDDDCIVMSDRGEEWGTCILPPEPCPNEMARRYNLKVLRKTTETDARNYAYIVDEEQKAREICLKKVKARQLPMKLVDVEFTFDKKKIIFHFTADDRVDFRELVRDLAHDLRARIEMRHIQVRDEAKMVGGIGGCGRELCCSSWMNEFHPISMRMAKAQNLSLNPSKISGQCGRLLCCLSYENEQYEAMRKKARQEAKARPVEEPRSTSEAPKAAVADAGASDRSLEPRPKRQRPPRREQEAGAAPRPERADAPAPRHDAAPESGPENAADETDPRPARRKRARRRRKRTGGDASAPGES